MNRFLINMGYNHNFYQGNPVINSSMITRKELCYWNKIYDGIEDYDMWLRLWKQNKKFYNYENKLVLHRIHNESAFNSKGNQNIHDLIKYHMNN